jgi:hypothetical protein
VLFSHMYSGRHGISAPSRKNALFLIDITSEPGLTLRCSFFKSSLIPLPIQSRIFSLVALMVLSLGALT